MEFWGVEVKPGQSLKVQPEFCKLIHISQASLGEVKDVKGAKNVPLRLKVDGKDFVIGSLAAEDRTQMLFDLVFEKEFELSHGWKDGSVYFLGYTAEDPVSDGDDFSDLSGSEEEDELMPAATLNGDAEPKSEEKASKKETFVAKAEESGSDKDEDDNDSDDEDDDSEDDHMESSEEELPQEKPTKKRPAESPKMTAAGKKAKPNQKGSPFAGKGAGKPQQGSPFAGKGAGKPQQGGDKFNKGSPFAGKGAGKPQQGGNKFNKGQKGKAGGQRR